MITLINAGLSFDKVSFVVSGLGFSSFVIRVVVPLRPGTDTETISWSKYPEKLCKWNHKKCKSYFILIFLLQFNFKQLLIMITCFLCCFIFHLRFECKCILGRLVENILFCNVFSWKYKKPLYICHIGDYIDWMIFEIASATISHFLSWVYLLFPCVYY